MRLLVIALIFHSNLFGQLSTKRIIVEGNGSPLVLLAGGRWDMQSFSKPSAALKSNHQVIRMEHFNVQFADEAKMLPSDYNLSTESEAILRTLDSINVKDPIILVGWSYGALIAMDFALNHPTRVKKLVLYEPPAFWVARAKGESPPRMEEMINLSRTFTPAAAISDGQLASFRCILDSCDTAQIKKHPQWGVWQKSKNRLRGLSAVANHTDSLSRLNQFMKPVLVLTGRGTVAFHRRINELLAAEFPKANSVEIGGGHSAPQQAVAEFIDAIKMFAD
jgi:pimeloyl-ACP methyl ester carboxylesterase